MFFSLLQAGEHNLFISYSRNQWEVIFPAPVVVEGICDIKWNPFRRFSDQCLLLAIKLAGIPERGEGREEVLHFQWGEGLQSSAKTIANPENRKLVIFHQIIREG